MSDNHELFVRVRLVGGPADGHEYILAQAELAEAIQVPTGHHEVAPDPLVASALAPAYVAPSAVTGAAHYEFQGLLNTAEMTTVVYTFSHTEPS